MATQPGRRREGQALRGVASRAALAKRAKGVFGPSIDVNAEEAARV